VRIEQAEVVVTSPGRNFVTLKLVTSDGVVGYGDATLNGREQAVVAYLREHVSPLLIDRDAHRIEDTWQYLYRGAYWRGGPVAMTAISAVDVALWDIKGKVAGLPVYQLLGGACRDGCLAYAHASGRDLDELLDAVAAKLELGYRAVRAQAGVPELAKVYGVASGGGAYEPAGRGARPDEELWDSRAYLRTVPGVFAALRAQFGPEPALLHDVHHRLTPLQAAQLGRALEPHDLFWLEDVTPAENPDALRLVREHTVTPLAIGEVFNTIWDCRTILQDRLVDYIRVKPSHTGGISHVRRILALAELSQIRSGCHGATDISPVGMAAALHVGLAITNFGIQEHQRHDSLVDEVFPHAYGFESGYLYPGDEPGLGVSLDEQLAAQYPYVPAYLPVNRLRDGTMHDW
jgi:mannonate dehydratase